MSRDAARTLTHMECGGKIKIDRMEDLSSLKQNGSQQVSPYERLPALSETCAPSHRDVWTSETIDTLSQCWSHGPSYLSSHFGGKYLAGLAVVSQVRQPGQRCRDQC